MPLADKAHAITGRREYLGDRHLLLAQPQIVGDHSVDVRVSSSHQDRPRWTTDRHIGISPMKSNSLGGQSIDVRRLELRIAIVTHRLRRALVVGWPRVLRERGGTDALERRGEYRYEADAVKPRCLRQVAQFDQGRIEVEQLGEGISGLAGGLHLRRGDEERDARVEFEIRDLGPESVLTEMETVIRTEDDHGAVGELLPIEFIEHLANLRVHEGDVGEVTMADFANGLGSERTLCVTANFAPVVSGDARGVRWPVRILRHRHVRATIHVPCNASAR